MSEESKTEWKWDYVELKTMGTKWVHYYESSLKRWIQAWILDYITLQVHFIMAPNKLYFNHEQVTSFFIIAFT